MIPMKARLKNPYTAGRKAIIRATKAMIERERVEGDQRIQRFYSAQKLTEKWTDEDIRHAYILAMNGVDYDAAVCVVGDRIESTITS